MSHTKNLSLLIYTLTLVPATTIICGGDTLETGDIEAMRKHALELAKKAKNKDEVYAAIEWNLRTVIRAAQDAECCTETSVLDIPERLKNDHTKVLKKRIKKKIITKDEIDDNKTIPILIKALRWVQERTDANKLVSPEGIKLYAVSYALESSNLLEPQNIFIPVTEWPQKRQDVLDEYYHQLKISRITVTSPPANS